jgi:endonuclease G, mitochondrial
MQPDNTDTIDRTDVVVTDSDKLAQVIAKIVDNNPSMLTPVALDARRHQAEADETIELRKRLIEGKQSDPNGYERIIGASNLLSVNYLLRGQRAAQAVCRIKLPVEGGHSYGTGFLVGPRLLMTNNHVLSTAAEAAQAEAEFDYEHDADGVLQKPVQFNCDPAQIFFTSTELDVTLVAITPMSENGVPIDRYGWLPLIPMTGKAIDGEPVTIIQHPNGDPKQIAIHASKVIKLDPDTVPVNLDHFIHYTTDTEPGSSGSPVLNDQWQVVALHHKAVPKPRPKNTPATQPIIWLANEGVRISAIFSALERKRFVDDNARLVLDRLSRAMGFAPISVQVVQDGVSAGDGKSLTEQSAPFKPARWKPTAQGNKYGYDPDFLSQKIGLGPIVAPLVAAGKVAPLKDGVNHELKYWHYSSLLHKERRFPLITAVNIHGNKLIHPGERKDTWRLDPRIDAKYQPDDEFYVRTRTTEKVYFSRGHLVRLLDPCWGETQADAVRGMEDSFHFTNAAPQHQTYNDIDWGNLEDYILDKAQTSERKLSVFTGPIFGDNDPEYGKNRKGGPWQIPLSFWKIAVLQKTATRIVAAAFIIGQTEYVKALYEARVFSGLKPYSIDEIRSRKIQTTTAAVEQATGLDFTALHKYDSHGSLESTRQTRWFNRLDDVLI